VSTPEARFTPPAERQRELVETFVTAARGGDLAGLERLLAEDVTWHSDGGGRVSTARRPIAGREKVLRYLVGALERFAGGWEILIAEVNGAPAAVGRSGEDVIAVVSFELRDGVIVQGRNVMNPDKLAFASRQLGGTSAAASAGTSVGTSGGTSAGAPSPPAARTEAPPGTAPGPDGTVTSEGAARF
jgi:RNA polymerase sigma-70 factor (ECF subfamily)